jgi:hypothetical protein
MEAGLQEAGLQELLLDSLLTYGLLDRAFFVHHVSGVQRSAVKSLLLEGVWVASRLRRDRMA